MDFKELFDKKLLIVSGKGGVGKTTVSLLLAHLASQSGKKTLLVEMNNAQRTGIFFGLKKVPYKEKEVLENLFITSIQAPNTFEEYILDQIHSKTIYSLIFENRYVRNFLDATPGLSELLQIGKVWALTERDLDKEKKHKYDLVILDAPATGHGLALLNVAQVVIRAIKMGPLYNQASRIVKLLQDPLKTQLIVTALAEEMPINEALEMLRQARLKLKLNCGPVILNGIFPRFLSDEEWEVTRRELNTLESTEELGRVVLFYQERVLLQKTYKEKLLHELEGHPCWELPFLFQDAGTLKGIKQLATCLRDESLT
ncbi:MAG: AAA family ATPase [Deltaproteobacteria bacterium]|nr:AAA family ATPase [Deltaproteobacteria bacterium]